MTNLLSKKNNVPKRSALVCSVFILFATTACVANAQGSSRGERRGPPPEAFTACEAKSSGVSCQVKTPHGDTVPGICESPQGNILVCVPEGHKDRNHDK